MSTTGCNTGPLTDNDTMSVCPIGLPGVGCWAERQVLVGGTVQNMRGCLMGNASYTCSDSTKVETCVNLEDGRQMCNKCCTNDKCNTFLLTGHNAAISTRTAASSVIFVVVATVAMLTT
jgi:hypothetical protein